MLNLDSLQAAELDEVLDDLLQRDTGEDPEQQVLGEIIMEGQRSKF